MSIKALDNNHEIVPVLNKIDLPAAEPDRVRQQIEDVIGLDASDAIEISAKSGLGVDEVLEAIVHRLPAPKGDPDAPLKALLVDSWYDAYLGVVVLVRIVDGTLAKGQRIRLMSHRRAPTRSTGSASSARSRRCATALAPARSAFSPPRSSRWPTRASATPSPTKKRRPRQPLPGFKPAQPVVFCGLFPVDASQFEDLREAMGKLRLNDACFQLRDGNIRRARLRLPLRLPRLLHLEIIRERLEREFNIDLITTAPSVVYHLFMTDGTVQEMHNPADMPDPAKIDRMEEPWIRRPSWCRTNISAPC